MVETTGEIRKRNVAYKLRIGDVLKGVPMITEGKFLFLELATPLGVGDQTGQVKKVVRVNMIANCVDKFIQEGEKSFASLTVDDASGQLKLKVFGEDIDRVKNIMQGDTLQIVGNMREWNGEIYMIPEVVKKVDPRWLLVRKLEIADARKNIVVDSKGENSLKNQILERIKGSESEGGIDKDVLVMDIEAAPEGIEGEVKKLLEEGLIYEPRPGRLRYLG
jgi:DNA polymerase III alpha subunit